MMREGRINEVNHLLSKGFVARHETFCPRYGWLKKGFDAVVDDAKIFERKDSIERLGVGLNMVRSIRFWCIGFRIVETLESSGPRHLSGPIGVTEFGRRLLSEEGWDPYLEDPASLWLLHWQLFSPPITAVSWSLAMNLGFVSSFSLKDLTQILSQKIAKLLESKRYAERSVAADASCFIRMYAPNWRGGSDEIECPFTHLGLLSIEEDRHRYDFNTSEKPSLPDAILLAACLDYASEEQRVAKTVSLQRLSYGFNSPGVVFRLSETHVGQRLERIAGEFDGIRFLDSFGVRQLQFDDSPTALRDQVLSRYYSK